MYDKILSRVTPLNILTLEEGKDQLRIIDFNDDDDLIKGYIAAASDMIEKRAKRLYSVCNVGLEIDTSYTEVLLPYPPITSITSVQSNGVDVDFTFSPFAGRLKLITSHLVSCEPLDIVYVAGYDVVPEIVKQSCRIIVSDLYNNRESMVDAKMTNNIFTALSLIE